MFWPYNTLLPVPLSFGPLGIHSLDKKINHIYVQKDNSPGTRSLGQTLTAEEAIGGQDEGNLEVGRGGAQGSQGKAGSGLGVPVFSDISWFTSLRVTSQTPR